MKKWLKRLAIVLTLILCVSGSFALGMLVGCDTANEPTPHAFSYNLPVAYQEPTLKQLADSLQLDVTGVNLFYADTIKDGSPEGIFVSPNTIYVLKNKTSLPLPNILAHEYLHYKRSQMPEHEKARINTIVQELYSKDKPMKRRMKIYVEKYGMPAESDDFSGELFSVYCTENSDRYIGILVADCNKYINRNLLTFPR